jgi:hypothetical protein
MKYFAKVENGIVTQVLVSESETFVMPVDSNNDEWLETCCYTRGGVHSEGGIPLRMNFAGVRFIYDRKKDAFIPPQPYPSWILNENTCLWDSPTTYPTDGKYYEWNESAQSWQEIEE